MDNITCLNYNKTGVHLNISEGVTSYDIDLHGNII